MDSEREEEREKRTKFIIWGCAVLAFVLFWAVFLPCALERVKIEVGYEGVLTDKPFIFGHGGVRKDSVKPGAVWVWWTTESQLINMQPQQFTVHFDDIMSSDGVPLDFDSVIRLRVINSVQLIEKFGPDWYGKNIEMEFRNRVRQSVRKHGMNETAISTKAIDEIDAEVSGEMAEYLKSAKLPVLLVQVTVGKANPPDSVKNQRIETANQQQRILTEQQRKLAEDQRRMAEISRAAADNAYREDMHLSPDQFLQLEQIKMLKEVGKSEKATLIMGGGATPVIDVGKKK